MIALKRYKPCVKRDIITVVVCYLSYFVVAVTMANLLNTNYCNLLYSNIPFMQAFLEWAGYIPYLMLMVTAGLGVPMVLILLVNFICKKWQQKKQAEQEIPEELSM